MSNHMPAYVYGQQTLMGKVVSKEEHNGGLIVTYIPKEKDEEAKKNVKS